MTVVLDDGPGCHESLPWEPSGRLLDGQWAFRRSAMGRAGCRRARSRAPTGVGGLTRRGVIYEYVRGHPGTHVRMMAKDLGLATGDLHYHLFWLERHGYVKTKKNGFYRLVFPTMVFREDQEVLLGVLSKETPRGIILSLLSSPDLTQGEIARRLGYSQPTISWHMDRLIVLGAVRKKRTSRGASYEVAADRHEVLAFVRSYHPEAWKAWASSLEVLARAGEGAAGEQLRPAGLMPPAMVGLVGKR